MTKTQEYINEENQCVYCGEFGCNSKHDTNLYHVNVGNCDHCGEFECNIDHDEDLDYEDDDHGYFNGSGMVGDD